MGSATCDILAGPEAGSVDPRSGGGRTDPGMADPTGRRHSRRRRPCSRILLSEPRSAAASAECRQACGADHQGCLDHFFNGFTCLPCFNLSVAKQGPHKIAFANVFVATLPNFLIRHINFFLI